MKTSVLICTYNRGNLINSTLESLITKQTRSPDEIIVVNGGGDNNCEEVLKSWSLRFRNLKEIKTKNLNLSNSRNIGIKYCTGDIILQTDDDAIPFPDWIELIYNAHNKFPNAGVIGGDVVDASGKSLVFKVADATTFPHYNSIKEVRNVPGVNSSYKKQVIDLIGEYDINLFRGEDVDYNWRVICEGWKVLYFPKIKVYHQHRATWRSLFNQHYMYGKAYFLVRKKWQNMYCHYPRRLNSIKSIFKLIFFLVEPFIDGLNKVKWIKGSINKIKSYPIIVCIQYYWRLGLFSQMINYKLKNDFRKN